MAERSSGAVTFLFTGVEGSIAIWERHPEAMRQALAVHDELMRSTIVAHGGRVFSAGGDGFAAAFDRAEPAARAAIAVQAALATATWPHDLELSVRMGLHSGEARERGGEFFGAAVNRASRVMDAANGAQIIATAATRELVGDDRGIECRWIDLGVHELRDAVDPVRLYRVGASAFESDPRPPRTRSGRAGNLPALAAQLVGRSDDVETVVAGLATARVVTLTGVGGIGKTALALEVGRRLQPQAPDGVWLAALDTIERPDALLPLLLSLFGVDAWAVGDLDSLLDGLRFRETLLILDNCEHVLDAAADVATAIGRACPKVRVLATSREPLDVQGERVRRVPSLSVGDDGTAAALFRLRAEDAGTKLDPVRDADVVAQICCRLDGIPLAIELAAARTRSLRPAEIADRLDDMFRLLTGGKRAAAERHRTLRATLEWSYDLLSDAERVVLARLAAFSGSFGLDAAAWIAGGVLGDAGAEIVDLLDRLVARSLVVPIDDADETRFRLLEPVRQLAAENLAARGDAETTRARHTEWYLGLIDRLGVLWRTGSDQAAWPIAKRELPNLRTAFDHLVETARQDDAERFVVAAYGPIGCQFDGAPMYEWAPKARAIDPGHIGPFSASTCAIAALGAIPRGDFALATQWLRLGVDAIGAGSYDDGLVCCAAIHQVFSGGEPAVTRDFLERSVVTALESDDLHRQTWVLYYAGRFAEGADCARRLGNRTLIALTCARALSTEGPGGARERFWEAARDSHSYLMCNHAELELGLEQINTGSPVDGLRLLRAPARDWLLRGDIRVWSVLYAMAIGFAVLGEAEAAARLAGAIGDRPLPFMDPRRPTVLGSLLDGVLDAPSRVRHEATGARLDAGSALMEALDRIDGLTAAAAPDDAGTTVDAVDLTPRQQEVARLVARGCTNKQIAQRLGISRFTAETHVRNILERLGAAGRSEIAAWYAGQPATGSGTPART